VIATVPFGMGMDCPDVRQDIHLGAPEDLEAYIQEQVVLEGMGNHHRF